MPIHQQFKLTTLAAAPERRQEVIDLISRAFQYPEHHCVDVDFHLLLTHQNAQNCHLVLDPKTERVIAHTAISLRVLGNQYFSTNVAIFGGIAVDDRYQGQGIMSNLLRYLINEYQDDIGFFMLWSDRHPLYAKHLFFPCGGQIQLGSKAIDSGLEKIFIKTKFQHLSSDQQQQIEAIHRNETLKWHTGFARTSTDWLHISNISSADWYLYPHPQKNSIIGGYFVANKGHDLQNIIHEIGYLPDLKNELLSKLRDYRLWLPEAEKLFYPDAELQFAALMRIGALAPFSSFIRNWSQGEIQVTSIAGQNVEFLFQRQNYQESHQHFLTAIFGPSPIKEFEKFGPPLYLSGLDSV